MMSNDGAWVSIDEELPKMMAKDIHHGGTIYEVKQMDGSVSISIVGDHNVWYYMAKECGITHWLKNNP